MIPLFLSTILVILFFYEQHAPTSALLCLTRLRYKYMSNGEFQGPFHFSLLTSDKNDLALLKCHRKSGVGY